MTIAVGPLPDEPSGDAIGDDGRAPTHDPGGQQVQGEMLVGELDRMAGVVSPVIPADDLEKTGMQVNDLSLALVGSLSA